MSSEGPAGTAVSEVELGAVLASLYRQATASSALDIARRTRLSTLVVIPALTRLVDDGLAARRIVDDGSSARRTWSYVLTVQGRRTYQSRM